MTGLHNQFDGNMSSCFFIAQWSDSSSEEKNCRHSVFGTQNHVHILGGHLFVTRHYAGCII